MKHGLDLLNDRVNKVFINYLLPSVGGMLGISLYVLGDTLIVGRGLGSLGLAALNISIPIMNIFAGLGFLFGVGGATIVSILRGEKKFEEVNKVFSFSLFLAASVGIILIILGLTFLDEFAVFMGANSDKLLNMSTSYLRPMFMSSLLFVLNSFMIIFLRNDNAPRLVMRAMLISSISNVLLDYLFIIVLNMGMFGAGLATSLSPIISLIIMSSHFIKNNNKVALARFSFKFKTFKRIISNGIPSFVIETMAGIVIFIFNIVILRLEGDIGVSACSIIANLSLFSAAVFNGIGQAIQPLISINHGAKKTKRVKSFVTLALYFSAGFGILFYSIGLFFPNALTRIFVSKFAPKLFKLSVTGIRIYFLSFLLMGINTTLISYLQSIEFSKASITSSIMRGFVFIIIGIIIWPRLWQINGVWLTIPIAELLTVVFTTLSFKPISNVIKYSFKFKKA